MVPLTPTKNLFAKLNILVQNMANVIMIDGLFDMLKVNIN